MSLTGLLPQLAATKTESLLNAMEAIEGHPLKACETLYTTLQQFVSQLIGLLGHNSEYTEMYIYLMSMLVVYKEGCVCVCGYGVAVMMQHMCEFHKLWLIL